MKREVLIEFLNRIPDDIEVEVIGEYGGTCDIEIKARCGKSLTDGWREHVDQGISEDRVIELFAFYDWKHIGFDDVNSIRAADDFVEIVAEARKANTVDWDKALRNEIRSYINSKPTRKQTEFASAISRALNLKHQFRAASTKKDYADFISKNLPAYQKWRDETGPSNFADDDDI